MNDKNTDSLIKFITWLDKFSESEKISFVLSITMDPEFAPEMVKKYII